MVRRLLEHGVRCWGRWRKWLKRSKDERGNAAAPCATAANPPLESHRQHQHRECPLTMLTEVNSPPKTYR